PKTSSSDRTIQAASPFQDAEVVDQAPNTERMMRTASPRTSPPREAATAQDAAPAAPVGGGTLALRPYEPSGSREPPRGRDHVPYGRHALPGPLSGKLDKRLILLSEPNSTRAASFRVLRDNLLSKSMPRVVA